MFQLPPAYLFLLLFILSSCVFEPDDIEYKPVNPPNAVGLSVKLSSANDTVYLFTKTTFSYHAELGNRKLINIAGYLDDQSLFYSANTFNSFTLDPTDYEPGTYIIRVEISASSGTNSMADKLELETVNTTITWLLIVDKTPPYEVKITDISPDNGTLRIQWEKYASKNFQAYIIEKYVYIKNYGFSLSGSYTISDRNKLSVYDTTYLNGRVKFSLKIKASDQISDTTAREFSHQFDSNFKSEIDGLNVKLTWRKSPFYKNFKTYDLETTWTVISRNIQDTVYNYKLRSNNFSTYIDFKLSYVSKGSDRRTDYKTSTIYHNGENFYRFTDAKFNIFSNRYYVTYGYYNSYFSSSSDSLYQIDAATGAITNRTTDRNYGISEDGKILYFTDHNIIQQIDPETFEVIHTFDISKLKNEYMDVFGSILVSNNNVVVIPTWATQYVVDMNTFTILHINNSYDKILAITPDAEHLFRMGTVYDRVGTSYKVGASLITNKNLRFIEYINADSAVAFYSNSALIFNPQSGLKLNQVSTDFAIDGSGYDRVSGLYFAYQYVNNPDQDFHIYNLHDNSHKIVKVNNTWSHIYKITNGKLLCSSGYYLDQP